MFRNTRLHMVAVLVAGALLGYLAASGKLLWTPAANADQVSLRKDGLEPAGNGNSAGPHFYLPVA